MRLKYLLRHIDERLVEPNTELLSVSKTHGVVPRAEISDTPGRAEDLSNYKTCQVDDLVINRMSAYQGALGIAGQFGAISPDYMVLRTTDAIRPGFAGYLFKSHFMISEMSSRVKGIGSVDSGSVRTPRLNWSDLGQVAVDLPPADQQESIAAFLDRETAKIDALIAKQEQLITTLDERRGAVISRAVTRGLLEDRPLRDSGVEWLGEIPADWDVRPCWSSFRRVKQTGFSEEELLSVYRDHGVVPKSSRDDNHNVESEDLTSYQLVRVGDMVMNKMKAWQGSIALSDHRGIVSPAYFVYRPTQEFSRKYFHYLLRSVPYVAQYNRISKGVRVGQWDLDPTYFRTTSLIVPPVEEQRRIADFLDSETARFDQLRAEATRMIRLLGERRQALISAAVTGKLEVGV